MKVLRSIAAIRDEDIVLGQYTQGIVGDKAVPGYREEESVAPDSTTETYAAVRLFINNWR